MSETSTVAGNGDDAGAIRRVACIGTGTIGSGWAALFLARGLDVSAWDPAPGAAASLAASVDGAWQKLTRLGLAEGASRERLDFAQSLTDAVEARRGHVFIDAPESWRDDHLIAMLENLEPPP